MLLLAIPIYKSNARGRSPISYLRSRSYSRQAEFSSSICHGKGKRYGISNRSIDRSMSWSSKRRGPLESCSPATSKGSPSVLLFSLSRERASSFLARLNFDTLSKWTKQDAIIAQIHSKSPHDFFTFILRSCSFFFFFSFLSSQSFSFFFSSSSLYIFFRRKSLNVTAIIRLEEVERWAAGDDRRDFENGIGCYVCFAIENESGGGHGIT